MTRKKILENRKSQRVRPNGRDPIPWKYCLLTLTCGLVLVVGFFLAARQHFSSIDFGIKNSKLRKQIENLEADKRRFILAKEIAMSPGEIKKAAQKLGFREMSASNIEVYRPSLNNAKDKLKTSLIEKPKQTYLNASVEPKKNALIEPKKEDKKLEKEAKKDGKPENKSVELKEKVKFQLAKK